MDEKDEMAMEWKQSLKKNRDEWMQDNLAGFFFFCALGGFIGGCHLIFKAMLFLFHR